MARLERPDVLLAVAGGLGVQGPDDFGAVAPVAGPMRYACFRPAEAVRRSFRIVAFVPGVADQDELVTDVAGRKLGGAAAAIVERLSGCGGQSAARVGIFDCCQSAFKFGSDSSLMIKDRAGRQITG
jgi:hypothetical protein